jgi:hypothetical protein
MDLIIQIGCFTISWHFVIVFRFFIFHFLHCHRYSFIFHQLTYLPSFWRQLFSIQNILSYIYFFSYFKHTREIQMYKKTKRFSFSLKMYPTFFFSSFCLIQLQDGMFMKLLLEQENSFGILSYGCILYCIYIGCRVGIAEFSSFSILGMHIEGISIQHSTQSQCLLLARVTVNGSMLCDGNCYKINSIFPCIFLFREKFCRDAVSLNVMFLKQLFPCSHHPFALASLETLADD